MNGKLNEEANFSTLVSIDIITIKSLNRILQPTGYALWVQLYSLGSFSRWVCNAITYFLMWFSLKLFWIVFVMLPRNQRNTPWGEASRDSIPVVLQQNDFEQQVGLVSFLRDLAGCEFALQTWLLRGAWVLSQSHPLQQQDTLSSSPAFQIHI